MRYTEDVLMHGDVLPRKGKPIRADLAPAPDLIGIDYGSPEGDCFDYVTVEVCSVKHTPTVVAVLTLQSHQCKWPIGEPGSSEFRFCCKPVAASQKYCANHHKAAVVLPSPRQSRSQATNPNYDPRRSGRTS